jgi:hypothetical protein
MYECATILHHTYITCVVFVVCSLGSGLFDELITRSEESYRVFVWSRNLNNGAAYARVGPLQEHKNARPTVLRWNILMFYSSVILMKDTAKDWDLKAMCKSKFY